MWATIKRRLIGLIRCRCRVGDPTLELNWSNSCRNWWRRTEILTVFYGGIQCFSTQKTASQPPWRPSRRNPFKVKPSNYLRYVVFLPGSSCSLAYAHHLQVINNFSYVFAVLPVVHVSRPRASWNWLPRGLGSKRSSALPGSTWTSVWAHLLPDKANITTNPAKTGGPGKGHHENKKSSCKSCTRYFLFILVS